MELGGIMKGMAIATAIMVCTGATVFAATYSDVTSGHWASPAISRMADKGIMVGDSKGKYNPDQAVDKFYTAKVLAKVAGYKYVGLSNEETLYINRAYDANKSLLQQFSKAFKKWDSTADKELSYLLEKGIFVSTDLNQFVVRTADGTEKLRALSREEYCTFLVRLMGKTSEASSGQYLDKFSDDSLINADAKPYVYYLKKLGAVTGDTNNKFNPNNAVTKAAMAVMTDKVVSAMSTTTNYTTPPTTGGQVITGGTGTNTNTNTTPITPTTPVAPTTNTGTTISSVSGSIYKVYTGLNAIQIKNASNTVVTYKINPTAAIYIDSYLCTINDLKEGMQILGVVANSEISEIRAQSVSAAPVTNETTNKQMTKVEGTVIEVVDNNNSQTIKIRVRAISARGIVTTSENTYTVANGCTVKRGGVVSAVPDIKNGEVIYAEVEGNNVYVIELEEKNINIVGGKLVAKQYYTDLNKAVLTVADAKGREHDFIVVKDSQISRKGEGSCKWSALRIGDVVNLESAYGEITKLDATGETATEIGWISEIILSNNVSIIKLREDENENSPSKMYTITSSSFDIQSLTLNSKIRLKLDSEEVIGLTVIDEASTKSTKISGFIYSTRSGYITVSERLESEEYVKIYIDSDTNVIDAVEGKTVKSGFLDDGMEVYVTVRNDGGDKYAKTVTVIDYND